MSNKLTVKEICELYDVSSTLVYNWMKQGLKYERHLKGILIDKNDADEFITEMLYEREIKRQRNK